MKSGFVGGFNILNIGMVVIFSPSICGIFTHMNLCVYIYTYSSREHPEASQMYARISDTVHHLDG